MAVSRPQSHPANSHAVRFRACQLVNKVLGGLSENAQLDDDLCEKIHEAMLVRVTDKYPNVRIQAALAMARLQDPGDPRCPTTQGSPSLNPDISGRSLLRDPPKPPLPPPAL